MLPKTVVGFSVSDIQYYWQMLAWKGNEGIDFHLMIDIGAIFVPFSPLILAYALVNYRRRGQGDWYLPDQVYRQLEFTI